MANKLALKSFRLKNFKAIKDSGVVKFTPLTVLIGDNGSGKSSLVEGLQTYQQIAIHRLHEVFYEWGGFENVCNPPVEIGQDRQTSGERTSSISFALRGTNKLGGYYSTMTVKMSHSDGFIYIDNEKVNFRNRTLASRDRHGEVRFDDGIRSDGRLRSDMSLFGPWYFQTEPVEHRRDPESPYRLLQSLIGLDWQFISLTASNMGAIHPLHRTSRDIRLETDGSNIAEYLLSILRSDVSAYEGIVETIKYVLPYIGDLQPVLKADLERSVYIQATEQDFAVPGWALSPGTLRILCLLALFRHPNPPPVIVIEEIENGLDPRSVQLIVEEIRRVTESGRSQIILTSHSPYLLDLFDLSHIVLVERRGGAPSFTRPDECRELDRWKERFGPGRLLSSGRLRNRELA